MPRDNQETVTTTDDRSGEVNWMELWEASGNDWRWMLADDRESSRRSKSRGRFAGEIISTLLLLVLALFLYQGYERGREGNTDTLAPLSQIN